jgi:hypothetical protein
MSRIALAAAFALSVAALPALAQTAQPAKKSHAEWSQECMRDVQKGLKAGQTMTSNQRMQAEAQCKAYADSKK